MKLLISTRRLLRGEPGTDPRRGAVLMLAMLVLFVLLLIVFQISISTGTDARVSRNEQTAKAMDFAIESYLLEAFEMLKEDGEGDASAGDAGGLGGDPMGGLGGAGEGGEEQPPSDSREDAWAKAQATNLNDVNLRVIIQDEDSKFNILALLTENEDEAEKAFQRLVRIIEYSRKGTEEEIDGTDARQMVQVMLEYMNRRKDALLPKTELLSDDEDNDDWGLPLSLRELVASDPDVFTMDHFRDYEDELGKVVHSLGTFLTVWTSLSTAGQAGTASGSTGVPAGGGAGADPAATGGDSSGTTVVGGADGGTTTLPTGGDGGASGAPTGAGTGDAGSTAGVAVNVNTAPLAVLKGLLDDRDLPFDWWESVLEYRNEVDEDLIDEDEDDVVYDEYGEPIEGPFQVFDSLDKLAEVDGWYEIEPLFQGELNNLLTTQSHVFSIFVTARKPTGEEQYDPPRTEAERKEQERKAPGLVRTVRCVVWRREGADGSMEIVPLQRWEVLDYAPIEVLDFPEDNDR